jgi:hypothetical protein
MESVTTAQLVAKLVIWRLENVPQNELIQQAIEKLEYLQSKIEDLEEQIDFLLTNEAP